MAARSGIRRVIVEHTLKDPAAWPGHTLHTVRWSIETAAGKPVTAGVYGVPDTDWPLLSALIRSVLELWPVSSPQALRSRITATALRCGWEAQP